MPPISLSISRSTGEGAGICRGRIPVSGTSMPMRNKGGRTPSKLRRSGSDSIYSLLLRLKEKDFLQPTINNEVLKLLDCSHL